MKRHYPPEYASAKTLAHRLDCSETTIHKYVRRGLLPKPLNIGELVRWRWTDVERSIDELEAEGNPSADTRDPYLVGIEHAATEKTLH